MKPTKTGEPRTPAGWKHQGEQYFCSECWRAKYILRAISMPVASPVDVSWEDLRASLKLMWQQTTAAANRIMTECYTKDVRRKPGEDKMPAMPRVYLYPTLREEFPGLPAQTVASLEQACQRKYRAARYDTVWVAKAALPTYRYPTPFPIPSQGWSARIQQERPLISLRIGDQRRELYLKGGPQMRRQLEQFRLIVSGEAVPGEAAIYQRGKALMVKMVAWLPRPVSAGARTGTLRVRTAPDSLLVAVNAKDEVLWKYNGDHLRRWAHEHRRQLQRWSEDSKYENRPAPSFAQRRAAAAGKFRDRMNSATHEIAAQLAGYALRRRFAAVDYNDSDHSSCEEMPWFRLRALIGEKLDERGIEFIASGGAEEKTPEPLAGEENAEE